MMESNPLNLMEAPLVSAHSPPPSHGFYRAGVCGVEMNEKEGCMGAGGGYEVWIVHGSIS